MGIVLIIKGIKLHNIKKKSKFAFVSFSIKSSPSDFAIKYIANDRTATQLKQI